MFIAQRAYDQCVEHREKIMDKEYVLCLFERLTTLLKTSSHLRKLQRASTKATQQYTKQTNSPAPENVANFAHFYVKVHEILERCIVWLYFYERPHLADVPSTSSAVDRSKILEPAAKKHRRDFARALNRLASRLMFTLNRLEDAIQRESFF